MKPLQLEVSCWSYGLKQENWDLKRKFNVIDLWRPNHVEYPRVQRLQNNDESLKYLKEVTILSIKNQQ